jgi:hypothetical protein
MIPATFGNAAGATGGVGPPVLEYIGENGLNSKVSSATFTAEPIGDAAADRLVVVGVTSKSNGAGSFSCTIGGVAATKVEEEYSNVKANTAIFALEVSAGTTADIVITSTINQNHFGIGVYKLTGLASPTKKASNSQYTSGTGTAAADLNVDSGDVIVGFVSIDSSTANQISYAGLTEDYDAVHGKQCGGGSHTCTTGETPRSLDANGTGISKMSFSTASWA